MTRLLLLRHGQSTWNAEGRWQGWADAPLSPLGERQALDAAAHLRSVGLAAACSSDLQRANRTARLIAGELGLGDVTVVPELRERHVGDFEGKTIEEIRAEYPECFDGDRRIGFHAEAETDDDLCRRALPALLALAERFAGKDVLVVSHGGVLRAVERYLGVIVEHGAPNLGGRWLALEDGALVAGEAYVPVEPGLTSVPRAE
jgi:probable phosphoglycerate mutase